MARVNHDIEHDSMGGGDGGQDDPRPRRVRSLLTSGQDPLDFAFPLVRVGGLRVRVHWVVVLYLVCELLASIPPDGIGIPQKSALLGTLLALAIVREVGRGLLARRLGSHIDHVTVWPVGGLNPVATPGTSRPMLAEMGGLLVNAALMPLLALGAIISGLPPASLIFNPFEPGLFVTTPAVEWTPLHLLLCSAYYSNAVLLAANLLLPMFPMDAGRMLAAAFRERGAFFASTERAGRFGMFTSVALFIVAAMFDQNRLMIIAGCGFLATLGEFRRVQFVTAPGADEGVADEPTEATGLPPLPARRKEPRSGAAVLESDLDLVLAKISREGLSSLTASEHQVLARETERRRRG